MELLFNATAIFLPAIGWVGHKDMKIISGLQGRKLAA
jgi:hypothetical protein